jgi:hypothetical protein
MKQVTLARETEERMVTELNMKRLPGGLLSTGSK